MENPIEHKTYVYVTSPEHRKYIESMAKKSGFKKQEGYTGKGDYISFWGDRVFTDSADLRERLYGFKQVFIDPPESNLINDSSIQNTSEAKNPIAPNTKIRILSEEHSEYVQRLAFKAGFKWRGASGNIVTEFIDFMFFYDDKDITKSNDSQLFGDKLFKEIFIELPTERNPSHTMEQGQKHDTGKPRYDLMPVHAEAAVVDVLTFGANKYAPDNWRHVESASERYTAAALRHIAAYRMGEHEDKESGLPHLAHAACCLMFMLELDSEADK